MAWSRPYLHKIDKTFLSSCKKKKRKVNCDLIDNTINYKIDGEKEPCEGNRNSVGVPQMDLSHQDHVESSGMLKEVALSSLLLLIIQGWQGRAQRTGEHWATEHGSVLEGEEKSKRLGSLISMPRMILEEISKLLLGVTSAPHICLIYTVI